MNVEQGGGLLPGRSEGTSAKFVAGLRSAWRFLRRRVAALVVVVALAVLAVLLTAQKRQLRLEAISLRERIQKEIEFPHTGMVVPAFDAVTMDGDSVTLGRPGAGTKQVLFILDTRCGNCLVTLPAWKRMANALEAHTGAVSVYGLSLNPALTTRSYVEEHQLNFPLVPFEEERYQALYRVRGVPITLVVDEIGAIEHVRIGSIFGDVESAIVDSVVVAALR